MCIALEIVPHLVRCLLMGMTRLCNTDGQPHFLSLNTQDLLNIYRLYS